MHCLWLSMNLKSRLEGHQCVTLPPWEGPPDALTACSKQRLVLEVMIVSVVPYQACNRCLTARQHSRGHPLNAGMPRLFSICLGWAEAQPPVPRNHTCIVTTLHSHWVLLNQHHPGHSITSLRQKAYGWASCPDKIASMPRSLGVTMPCHSPCSYCMASQPKQQPMQHRCLQPLPCVGPSVQL